MKIISRGNTHGGRKMTCLNCNCKFEYKQDEVMIENSGDRFPMCAAINIFKVYIECPECKERMYLW